jgi:3-deoxy-manno-octulosonate cytidylyltransferase (CMP-KDO synthetase)
MIVIGIIPARFASTRFPGKPLVDINGKSMIQRVYEQAQKALPHVCVATDDNRIKEAVLAFGGEVVMTSEDHESGTDRCAEATVLFEQSKGLKADVVINIQGDEPFIDPIQINQLVAIFKNDNAEIATLIKKVEDIHILDDKNVVKVVRALNSEALYFSRSCIPFVRNINKDNWLDKQEFFQHVGMYGYRKSVLMQLTKLQRGVLESAESLEQLRWLENGYKIKTAITDIDSVGIDTPEDLKFLLSRFQD